MTSRPYQKNAADPKQGRHAERKAKDRRARELGDLRAVLETEPGRRVFRRLLRWCGANQTVLRASAIDMAAAAGQQNVGHYIQAEIEAADDEVMFTMMREARADEARDNRETDAVHTTSAEENPDVE